MKKVVITPFRKKEDIEPHCNELLDSPQLGEAGIESMRQQSYSIPDFFRSECLERVFLCGYDVFCFLDSDTSCHPSELIEVMRKSEELEQAKQPAIHVTIYPHRPAPGEPPTAEDKTALVGHNLHLMNNPPAPGVPFLAQQAPPDCLFGCGLFVINRSAWLAMCERYPLTVYSLKGEIQVHPLFKSEIVGEHWYPEDYAFFKRAHAARVPIYVEPIRVGHGFGTRLEVNYLWGRQAKLKAENHGSS